MQRYHTTVAEWMVNGQQCRAPCEDLTVTELAAAYWRFAKTYFTNSPEHATA